MDYPFTRMRMDGARSIPLGARALMAAVAIALPLRVSSQAAPRQIPLGEAFVVTAPDLALQDLAADGHTASDEEPPHIVNAEACHARVFVAT